MLVTKLRLPWKSSAHRIAAKALYRALLVQSRKSGLTKNEINGMSNVIRNRFKENYYNSSKHALPLLFKAGYQAIDHLDAAAAGIQSNRTYLRDLLARVPASSKRAPRASVTRGPTARKQSDSAQQSEEHEKKSVFDRPRPLSELSGKRHIPRLFSAATIPVLRIKKPQPFALGAFVRNRLRQREARFRLKDELDEQLLVAEREDAWDDISMRQHRTSDANGKAYAESRWTDSVNIAWAQVSGYLSDEAEKNIAMAARMQKIVDDERAMAKQEREDRAKARKSSTDAHAADPAEMHKDEAKT